MNLFEALCPLSTKPGRAWCETHKEELSFDDEIVRVIEDVGRTLQVECSDRVSEFFQKARAVVET